MLVVAALKRPGKETGLLFYAIILKLYLPPLVLYAQKDLHFHNTVCMKAKNINVYKTVAFESVHVFRNSF